MSYKQKTVSLGFSDVASLVARFCNKGNDYTNTVNVIEFGGDNDYKAYVIENEPAPDHYELVASGERWLHIYDDYKRVAAFNAERIEIYRAGQYGCLIRLINAK